MKLEVLPAKSGDCMLLHCGSDDDPKLILVDGGPSGVWQASLKKRLLAIRAERSLADNVDLVLELVIVSHVDDDHINGVLRLLEFIKERKDAGQSPLIRIRRIWHNSFDSILDNDETIAVLTGGSSPLASTGGSPSALVEDREPGDPYDAAFVLASIQQGDDLRRLACALGIPINPDFGGGLIEAVEGAPKSVSVGGATLIVAGPLHDELKALQAAHDKWLLDHPERRANPQAILAALDDKSVANLSSIVVFIEAAGKAFLLTGDARADKVLKGLELAGVMAPGAALDVDVLKMPHHGSIRNIDGAFIERLPAKFYVFCGDGKHGNPDRETFDLLFSSASQEPKTIVLNHKVADIDPVRHKEFDKEEAKRIARGKPASPPWTHATHSLDARLSPPPADYVVVPVVHPIMIDP